jgi:hypothetical protein
MMLSLPCRFLCELNLLMMVALTLGAETAIRYENTTNDQLLILWCLIGGFGGSFCSLRFFQQAKAMEAGMQFATNLIISTAVSPFLVDAVAFRCDLPVGLRLALPVSLSVGMLACSGVSLTIPYLEKWINKKGETLTK